MTIKFHYISVVFWFLVISPVCVHYAIAQEGSYSIPDAFEEAEPLRDRIITSPGEADPSDSRVSVTVIRDSASIRPKTVFTPAPITVETPPTQTKSASQDDDSLLSFNFLYYLFEKYKLQDIVD